MKIFQAFLDKGLVKEEKIDFAQIEKIIKKAHRSIKSAKVLLEDNDSEGSYQLSYEAMLLAGRALVFSYNYRPRTAGSHKIVVEFSEKVLGEKDFVIVSKFDRMRKNRHYLIYGSGLAISETEAKNAIISANKFVSEVEKIIQKRNPQKKLEL
jgi:uncharacterized protein (UPF0332 family)